MSFIAQVVRSPLALMNFSDDRHSIRVGHASPLGRRINNKIANPPSRSIFSVVLSFMRLSRTNVAVLHASLHADSPHRRYRFSLNSMGRVSDEPHAGMKVAPRL